MFYVVLPVKMSLFDNPLPRRLAGNNYSMSNEYFTGTAKLCYV